MSAPRRGRGIAAAINKLKEWNRKKKEDKMSMSTRFVSGTGLIKKPKQARPELQSQSQFGACFSLKRRVLSPLRATLQGKQRENGQRKESKHG